MRRYPAQRKLPTYSLAGPHRGSQTDPGEMEQGRAS